MTEQQDVPAGRFSSSQTCSDVEHTTLSIVNPARMLILQKKLIFFQKSRIFKAITLL